MKRKTPQEKKALSLERDSRNSFRENDKASRKAIPARKRQRARAERRLVAQQLDPQDVSDPQLEASDVAVDVGARRLQYRWGKQPDTPLREHVKAKLRRRT
jgi:hypothetical protein